MKKLDSVTFHLIRAALNWTKNNRVLTVLIAIAIATLLTVRVEIDKDKQRNILWADWTGFGADSTENKERVKNEVTKTIEIQQSGKTLWDFLQLFGTVALPVLLLFLANRFQQQEKERTNANQREQERKQEQEEKIAKDNQKLEKEKTEDNQRGQELEIYIDRIGDILLEHGGREEVYERMLKIIQARTLEILKRLDRQKSSIDHERKGRILLFLHGLELICTNNKVLGYCSDLSGETGKTLLDLSTVDFTFTTLVNANLINTNFRGANLSNAILIRCDLRCTDLSGANFSGADLRRTNLKQSNLSHADFTNVDFRGADFSYAKIRFTSFSNAKYDSQTTLPEDFDPELHGMVMEYDLPI